MLEKLLQLIREGDGTISLSTLAARLNTNPFIVQAMLQHLASQGYLKNYTTDCDLDSCGGCGLKGACKTSEGEKPQIWTLSNPAQVNPLSQPQPGFAHKA